MNGKQFTISTILVAVFAIFAIYIWPTRYMYTHTAIGTGTNVLVRVDRFSGESEWLTPNGWMDMKPIATPTPANAYYDPYDKKWHSLPSVTPTPDLRIVDPFEEKRKRLERDKALGIVDPFASPTPRK